MTLQSPANWRGQRLERGRGDVGPGHGHRLDPELRVAGEVARGRDHRTHHRRDLVAPLGEHRVGDDVDLAHDRRGRDSRPPARPGPRARPRPASTARRRSTSWSRRSARRERLGARVRLADGDELDAAGVDPHRLPAPAGSAHGRGCRPGRRRSCARRASPGPAMSDRPAMRIGQRLVRRDHRLQARSGRARPAAAPRRPRCWPSRPRPAQRGDGRRRLLHPHQLDLDALAGEVAELRRRSITEFGTSCVVRSVVISRNGAAQAAPPRTAHQIDAARRCRKGACIRCRLSRGPLTGDHRDGVPPCQPPSWRQRPSLSSTMRSACATAAPIPASTSTTTK